MRKSEKGQSQEVQRRSGATRRQLVRWVEEGIIIPLQDTTGKGVRRVFSEQNISEAILARYLTEAGFQRSSLKEILSWLRQPPPSLVALKKVGDVMGDWNELWDDRKHLYPSLTDMDRLMKLYQAFKEGTIQNSWDLQRYPENDWRFLRVDFTLPFEIALLGPKDLSEEFLKDAGRSTAMMIFDLKAIMREAGIL